MNNPNTPIHMAFATLLVGGAIFYGSQSLNAAPFGLFAKTATVSILHKIYGEPADWRDEGPRFHFENCWWQKQRLYSKNRITRKIRNRKVSCPGLS